MTDAFDTTQATWTYSAVPAQILYTTTLPILNRYVQNNAALPHPTHDAAWWEAKTKGFDFSQEDRIDSDQFNRIIWEGLMGEKPYPTIRLKAGTPQPETKEVSKSGSE
jgi:hypothetical protein